MFSGLKRANDKVPEQTADIIARLHETDLGKAVMLQIDTERAAEHAGFAAAADAARQQLDAEAPALQAAVDQAAAKAATARAAADAEDRRCAALRLTLLTLKNDCRGLIERAERGARRVCDPRIDLFLADLRLLFENVR